MTTRILILEEDASLREKLGLALAGEGCEIVAAADADSALQRVAEPLIDAVVVGRGALGNGDEATFRSLLRGFPESTFLLAGAAEGLAEEALRRGIRDTLVAPYEASSVRLVLRRVEERSRQNRRNRLFQRDVLRLGDDRPIVASSSSMIDLLENIEKIAEYETPVLLSGEIGSGLEILGRAIHAQSIRRNRPFVALHCRSTSTETLQADLFGESRPGATGSTRATPGLLAEAKGGSLFLEEISALPESLQSALLRVLHEEQLPPVGTAKPCPVDVRLLASTSLDLKSEVAAGRFQRELFELMNAVPLAIPPLRERPGDIPLLVDHFVAHASRRHGRPLLEVSGETIERLVAYDWPGNVRELEIAVERAVMLAQGDRITPRDLPDSLLATSRRTPNTALPSSFCLKTARKSLEADMIRQALRATDGNRTHAAKLLKISHRALLYKIKEYGVRD